MAQIDAKVDSIEITPSQELNYDELKELLKTKKVTLIDVRRPDELAEVGKYPIGINIPLDTFETALLLSSDEYKAKYLGEKPSVDDENVVVCCGSGRRSKMALKIAISHGYLKARHFQGGYKVWLENQGS